MNYLFILYVDLVAETSLLDTIHAYTAYKITSLHVIFCLNSWFCVMQESSFIGQGDMGTE